MRNALARKAYWAVNKLTPLDITQVLLLDLTECREPKHDVSSFELGFVGADDVRRLTKSGPCELRPELSAMIERGEARCFAAVNKDRLAAYCWFAQDRVSPEHNAGGNKFAGSGLSLPDKMA